MLDYKRFTLEAKERDTLIEILQAMPEIKTYGLQRDKRWSWERIAVRSYKVQAKGLALRQSQRLGILLASNFRNILITLLAARAVINGQMTLGMMLATQYIVGQLNSPISRLIDFIQTAQDARLSLERMQEIYSHRDDEEHSLEQTRVAFPRSPVIELVDLRFRYPGAGQPEVLRGVNLTIPVGKVTAIVGASGSGKTTLLKLLLNLYRPTGGEICLNEVPLLALDDQAWRARCGVVMQDGYIFSGSIARNIALGSEAIDPLRLRAAIQLASLEDYLASQPNGVNTTLGSEGQGLSGGQRQRILLARAIYRMPDFLFLDEATSSLDGRTENAFLTGLRDLFAAAPSSSSPIDLAPCVMLTKLSSSSMGGSSSWAPTQNSLYRTGPIYGSSAISSSWKVGPRNATHDAAKRAKKTRRRLKSSPRLFTSGNLSGLG